MKEVMPPPYAIPRHDHDQPCFTPTPLINSALCSLSCSIDYHLPLQTPPDLFAHYCHFRSHFLSHLFCCYLLVLMTTPAAAITTSLSVLSPCKLNLFLYILGKRPDGFHNLQSLFCLLDYGDTMSFTVTADDQDRIDLPEIKGIAPEDNLIYKAIKLLKEHRPANHDSISVTVDKRIPMGGGLGGGSSNAATALLVVNHLCKLQVPTAELMDLGARLGSDIPFFVRGHSAYVEGRGERVYPTDINTERYYLVVTPPCHVSTKEIFTAPELPQYYRAPCDDITSVPESAFANDCVDVVRKKYPQIGQVLERLLKYGSPAMSGTGASCFCAFSSREQAQQALHELSQDLPANYFIARPLNTSPLWSSLADSNL